VERLARLVCAVPGCGGQLGFISRDEKTLVVENEDRVPGPQGGLIIKKGLFPLGDPKQLIKADAPRARGIAPLRCSKCNGTGTLLSGQAADALIQRTRTGRMETLKVAMAHAPRRERVDPTDWTE